MDSFTGSSSAAKTVDDENKKPEYSPPTGKTPCDQTVNRNIMLENFQVNDENKKPEYSPPTGKPPADQKVNRNIMLEKFQANVKPSLGQYTYIPKPFFFYGSLMDPLRLQEILQLPTPPVLKPARVKSYKIMLWGQYPALVDGLNNSYVDGMSYVVETEKQQKMLEHYETDVYSVEGIRITIQGKEVSGRTFMWADDPTELIEGTWSLEEWKNGVEEEMASHFRPVEN